MSIDKEESVWVISPFSNPSKSETEYAHPTLFVFLSDITQREKLYERLDQRENLFDLWVQ